MTKISYEDLFKTATGFEPFPYQVKIAKEDYPDIIDVSTGAGKTASVVISWLWKRRYASEEVRKDTPRRLVYCLPMRVLVEQTRDECVKWLKNLGLSEGDDGVSVTLLMGGEDKDEWDLYPDKDEIIIGTQDMLLSRALNRGYGMSRYRWPVHFSLLNNDSLWIMDETQLMGVGVETSAQLDAFRKKLHTYGPSKTVWMSATVTEKQLDTVDREGYGLSKLTLSTDDEKNPTLSKRNEANKVISGPLEKLTKDDVKGDFASKVAEKILERHVEGELTLVILNTVVRAQEIYDKLLEMGREENDTVLIHSRFRSPERAESLRIFEKKGDRIVVSTQVVEAGMDISAKVMITEIASWPSLVQRFGRCNRKGEHEESFIYWIDLEEDLAPPYEPADLDSSREILENVDNASPNALREIEYESPMVIRPVIRKKDIIELFDTTPDLTGNDIDISRYVRDGEERDAQVYWREIPEDGPDKDIPAPSRGELCSVPIYEINSLLKKKNFWMWNHLEEGWTRVTDDVIPGTILLLDSKDGCYRKDLGWIGKKWKKRDGPVEPISDIDISKKNESTNSEDYSTIGTWVTIPQHCMDVKDRLEKICKNVTLDGTVTENTLTDAALWHDIGKAHPAFQNGILERTTSTPPVDNELWAKSDMTMGWVRYFTIENGGGEEKLVYRKYFRHELASALAWLKHNGGVKQNSDLTAYLIASHHGKVRQSIRSIPDETEPEDTGILFARGVWHGDALPPVSDIMENGIELDLTPMVLGEGSWLEMSLKVLNEQGPFRLGFLETLLRISDWQVSRSYNRTVSK